MENGVKMLCEEYGCLKPGVWGCHASCCSGEGWYCKKHDHTHQTIMDYMGYPSSSYSVANVKDAVKQLLKCLKPAYQSLGGVDWWVAKMSNDPTDMKLVVANMLPYLNKKKIGCF